VAFTDSHAHLDDHRFEADRADVLARARQAGVRRILTIGNGTGPADFQKTLGLLGHDELLWGALGIHPHQASRATEASLKELEELVQLPRVLAWGEIGLDYHYDHSAPEVQQRIFRRQLQGARALKLPVVIHCRDAWDDCLQILAEEWAGSGLGGILHCFSGTMKTAERAVEEGFLISFAGNVTFPRAEGLRAVAGALRPEHLLIETDCPYLAPQPMRGKRNEPAYVAEVAAVLGRLHGLTPEEMGARTSENFLRLFPRVLA
jgi:TatD DNase family protein